MKPVFLAIVMMTALCGCVGAGNQVLKKENDASVSQKIVDGKTTKSEIKSMFGDPNETSFTDGGNEIWKYTYAYATPKAVDFVPIVGIFAGGADVDKKELVLLFDKNDLVTKHTMNVSNEGVKHGG